MLWGVLRCLILPHQPDRRRVKKLGSKEEYYGYCAHCGTKVRRIARDRWVRAWRWPEDARK